MSDTTIYKGAVAPETFKFRIVSTELPAIISAVIRVKKAGVASVDWPVDDIDQDPSGAVLYHIFQSGDTNTLGDYSCQAILTVAGGTLRSYPGSFTIADPLP